MPIKLPKTFTRQKSTGNVLEKPESPTESGTFRVLNRDEVLAKTHNGGDQQRLRSAVRPNDSSPQQKQQSFDIITMLSNRYSAHTSNSNSTGRDSNSRRLSYASTTPSSVDEDLAGSLPANEHPSYIPLPGSSHSNEEQPRLTEEEEDLQPRTHPESHSQPKFRGFPLKGKGRAFSFEPKQAKPVSGNSAASRHRSVTSSSYASTAKPLKLDLGSHLDWDESQFGANMDNMFEDLAEMRSTILEEVPLASPIHPIETHTTPISNGDVQDYSHIPSSPTQKTPSLRNSRYSFDFGEPDKTSTPHSQNSSPRQSGSTTDLDAQLVMDAVLAGRALDDQNVQSTNVPLLPTSSSGSKGNFNNSARTPLSSSPNTTNQQWYSPRSRPNASMGNTTNENDDPLLDVTPKPKPGWHPAVVQNRNHKIMTPTEFERYKLQKAENALDDDSASDKSNESDAYEDAVDETERNREIAKQRSKQEAHLAVYRQKMMKVTGQQPSDLPPRVTLRRASLSAPVLLSVTPSSEPVGNDEEDEDIPLAVLQAHGFPSKTRPPARPSSISTSSPRGMGQPNLAYPAPHGSTRNEVAAGGGGSGSLPVFARNLPADPYIGASLVRPPNRESLAYNRTGTTPPPPLGGGLVGIIAGEERARAARRGSPNTRGSYDPLPQGSSLPVPQQMQSPMHMSTANLSTGSLPNMGAPMITSTDQSQAQLSSMQQMMQMQVQLMQQMVQIQSMSHQSVPVQAPVQPHQINQNTFLSPGRAQMRPKSMGAAPVAQQRLSMLNGVTAASSQSVFGLSGHYAPSIAPSERSNIGQPSRYRPVTPAGDAQHEQAKSWTVSTQAQNYQRSRSLPREKPMAFGTHVAPTVRVVDKPKGRSGGLSDDEDDEAWRELKKKRDEKKAAWRASRSDGAAPLSVVQERAGMEGLYYDG